MPVNDDHVGLKPEKLSKATSAKLKAEELRREIAPAIWKRIHEIMDDEMDIRLTMQDKDSDCILPLTTGDIRFPTSFDLYENFIQIEETAENGDYKWARIPVEYLLETRESFRENTRKRLEDIQARRRAKQEEEDQIEYERLKEKFEGRDS